MLTNASSYQTFMLDLVLKVRLIDVDLMDQMEQLFVTVTRLSLLHSSRRVSSDYHHVPVSTSTTQRIDLPSVINANSNFN